MVKNIRRIVEPIARRTRSHNPKLKHELIHKKKIKHWVSATSLRNHISNNGLVDLLKLRNSKSKSSQRSMTFPNFLCKQGNEFEEKVMNYIGKHHAVSTISDWYSEKTIKKTIETMKTGVPIIYSAPLSNELNNTYGVADLLVRSDYVKKLIKNVDIPDEEFNKPAPNLGLRYHYIVIDIKFFNLNLKADGKHLLNTDKTRSYKSQLCIYNDAIGEIQGYTPRYSFLLGRGAKHTSCNETFVFDSCLDKLGIVDFHDVDDFCIEQTQDAVEWQRRVLNDGINWDLEDIDDENLLPNMKVESYKYDKVKQKMADDIGEITMIWRCGVKNRKIAFENGITSWKDPKCNSKTLGITPGYAKTVDAFIHINRDSDEVILPKLVENNIGNWQEFSPNEMFVDFETISDVCTDFRNLPQKDSFNIIFLIGAGWKEGGKWKYKRFICNSLDLKEENKIMNEFYNLVQSRGNPNLYFWDADERMWASSRRRQSGMKITEEKFGFPLEWVDMANIFRKEPIVIKGTFGYGLKPIVKKMNDHGLIDISMQSDCKDGMMAMVKGWYNYRNNSIPAESPIMNDISRYNEFDCEVLQKILYYMRKELTDYANYVDETEEDVNANKEEVELGEMDLENM